MNLYENVKFDFESRIQDFCSPWSGHKYFAYDFVRNVRPGVVVELGSYKGTSFYSLCHAVKDADYDARLYAVDTWQGDEHGGFYEENVFNVFRQIKEECYGNLRISLLRKKFDEAVGEFKDDSIDLLHIDGLHTYKAVKHDFETWFYKVKRNGVIFLHDICVNRDDFGVNKFWEELRCLYKTIEFHQSCGLGVLFKNGDDYQMYIDRQREFQIRYARIAEDRKNEEMAKLLTQRDRQIANLDEKIANLKKRISILEQTMEETINNIYQSTSWRLTRPLRFFSSLIKHGGGIGS